MKIIYGIYLLVLAAVVQADDESDCLDFHVIKNAPLGFINTDNESAGVHWEYLTALEKETGFCINKTYYPMPEFGRVSNKEIMMAVSCLSQSRVQTLLIMQDSFALLMS